MRGMLPAHQGFDARDKACFQLGFRLVVQSQLMGGNGLAQFAEEGEAVPTVLIKTSIVQDASFMSPFGNVHGYVRTPEEG